MIRSQQADVVVGANPGAPHLRSMHETRRLHAKVRSKFARSSKVSAPPPPPLGGASNPVLAESEQAHTYIHTHVCRACATKRCGIRWSLDTYTVSYTATRPFFRAFWRRRLCFPFFPHYPFLRCSSLPSTRSSFAVLRERTWMEHAACSLGCRRCWSLSGRPGWATGFSTCWPSTGRRWGSWPASRAL